MKTTVVNLKAEHDTRMDGTFKNPFASGSRETNISNFRRYFFQRMELDKAFREKVMALKGKRLGCFCPPLPCHVDVIADFLNGLKEP